VKRTFERLLSRNTDLWWLWRKWEIRRRGWSSVSVADADFGANWTYTVGFNETLNHPEIVIANESRRKTLALFACVYDAVRRVTLAIEDGQPWERVGQPRGVWRRVHPTRIGTQWFGMAMWRRDERGLAPRGLEAFQLVTPDREGALPWEPGYQERMRAFTPELWRPEPTRQLRRSPAYDT